MEARLCAWETKCCGFIDNFHSIDINILCYTYLLTYKLGGITIEKKFNLMVVIDKNSIILVQNSMK